MGQDESRRRPLKAAIYARVSTDEQSTDNQVFELKRYCAARGWTVAGEYIDHAVSGSRERRPSLDALMTAARRRQVDVVVCWRLDRLGRNLKHLINTIEEWSALGVAFVSLNEGIDATTPAGKLQLHVLAAISEFERARLRERVQAGLARARRQGQRLGRPRKTSLPARAPHGLTVRAAALLWRCSKSTAARRLSAGELPPLGASAVPKAS